MPKIDARIEALEKLIPLKVRLQRGRTRAWSVRRGSIYAALLLSTMAVGDINEVSTMPSPCPGATAWNEAHREQLPEAMAARDG